ncbi:L-threonine synthase [Desulfocicer vacuolatum DSM 3385]|uniref:Threonine synthase n=1 Tax=Desulfocicer vacuolatum DSM 3385 TaxID=1121400 RepID=A0A1W1ZTY6_9BACT|nr:threonine synthase [Desulfocicer vacuolatum]SMC51910.1 L-threonine synthase [Desulfocicer vacuolatum DSM 3385]
MKPDNFPKNIQPHLIPEPKGELYYQCLGCSGQFSMEKLLYVCPRCGQVLLIENKNFDDLKNLSGSTWQQIFDYRRMLNIPALKGIYRFHEFIGPTLPLDDILYLGEGHTPMVAANAPLQEKAGVAFYYKNDGQNPSASFKDRGMASALSYINHLINKDLVSDVIAVCASTGDTSAAAALYAAYLQPHIKSAVLLPHKKVTPQQLSQPLGSGARVFEIPGVFDDCMKIVEKLSEEYPVALLNSKNAWRILGQESYSYEIAQDFDYDMKNKVVVVPIGNAGNISAVMNGFMKFHAVGIIDELPKIIGVQSKHADPVYRYYLEPEADKRVFTPVTVQPSVAQAAMIGNPVSMPRVMQLVEKYNAAAGEKRVFVTQVTEQEIMDWGLEANRNGHIACTQGGECLAGLARAVEQGIVHQDETAIVDATAHAMKFSGFQDLYYTRSIPEEYGITSKPELINAPRLVLPRDPEKVPAQGAPLSDDEFKTFAGDIAQRIASELNL